MRTHIAICFAILAALSINSCGVAGSILDQGVRVQTTFFGATFGDKDEYDVRDKMQYNGIGYGWTFIEKGTWGISGVSFAGYDWQNTLVKFTDNRFSSIIFGDTFSNEADALKRFDEVLTILQKKYKLQQFINSQNVPVYYYKDSLGNQVFVTTSKLKLKDSERWTCGICYSWYKAPQIAEEKTLNEI